MRPLIAFLALLPAACASPAMDPDLTLYDRFIMTALSDDDGSPLDQLYRREWPIYVAYDGPPEYRQDVADTLAELGQVTGLEVSMDHEFPNTFVEISDRDTGYTCVVELAGGLEHVQIDSSLSPSYIRQCIAQELAHVPGPSGDLDGYIGSRDDTVFASWGGAQRLTEQDIAVLRILYDPRLRNRMPRPVVLERLPEIIADLYPEQAFR